MPKKIHFNVSLPAMISDVLYAYDNILLLLPARSLDGNSAVLSTVRMLENEGKVVDIKKISSELSNIQLEKLLRETEDKNYDCVLAVGGGSVMDAGKFISAAIPNRGSVEDYLDEKVEFAKKSLPLVLAPTTHASSEADSSVVICSHYIRNFRKEIRNRAFIADEIIIDPSLSVGASKRASINSMMITLTRLIEGYVSTDSNRFCDALIADCISDFVQSVYDIYVNDIDNETVRFKAAYASVVASVTREHAGTGIITSLADAITSVYQIPYGAVCGSLLYHATLRNMQKTQMFAPKSLATEKYSRLASIWSGIGYEYDKHNVLLRSLNHNLSDLRDDLRLPGLSQLGVEKDSFYSIVSKVSTSQNPVNFAESELIEILEAAY